ncbi:MAG: alpha/beta hydrolase [Oceanicaulis sp.]
MRFEPEILDSPSGARLAVRVRAPEGEPRGIVQIHHGLSEHAGRYEDFAEFLADRGFAVGAHDHRGHGRTDADDALPGVFAAKDGAGKVTTDALAVETLLRTRFADTPLIVFGHSMGGVIAMNHAMQRDDARQGGPLAGLAIWNSNLDLGPRAGLIRFVLGAEKLFRKKTAPSSWMDALTFSAWGKAVKGGSSRFDWLSRDADAVKAYVDDPLCGRAASISLWEDLLRLNEIGEDEHRLRNLRTDLPIHLATGGEDPATDKGKAVKTLASRLYNARFTDVTMRFDPSGRHETLNDLGKDKAMEDFADWAGRVFTQTG